LPAFSESLSIRGERIEQAGIEQQQLSASRPIVREQASSPALDSLAASYTPQDEVGRQANENIARLEMKVGRPITGRGREILFAALIENPQGVLACWKQRAEHGDNPIGLLLHLLELGEHRTRVLAQTYPRCLHCGHESSDVHDVAPDLRARGTYPEGEYPMCDSCAEHFPNLKDPILGRV